MREAVATHHPRVQALRNLQARMREAGDVETAARLGDVIGRLETADARPHIAFCGLFSAGKSSLINAIARTDARPTGAVPTTAAVEALVYEGPAGALVLLDTPGIDSTDAAHQAEMEAALHRADGVVLVMDYQHVEAEENLDLAHALIKQGKRLILAVNQVDKHVDWELDFDEYRRRVEQTLADYDIACEGLYYTSTRGSAHNQLDELRRHLDRWAAGSDGVAEAGIRQSLRELVREHAAFRFGEALEAAWQRVCETTGSTPEPDAIPELREALAQEWARSAEARDRRLREVSALREEVRQSFLRLIDLAQIAPYETTELGRLYVESLRPDFKVGWFGAREKTAREREARRARFVADLAERTDKFLLAPLHNGLREWIRTTPWADTAWLKSVDTIRVTVDTALVDGQVRQGALVSDQYPYQYVKDVVAAIKRQAYGGLTRVLEGWWREADGPLKAELAPLEAKMAELEAQVDAISAWQGVAAERDAFIEALWREIALDEEGGMADAAC
ncbi:MAG: dynamin family protein [Alicyclobacillus macrosporangiidus]|uniref:dynamin family protein n=1 Tax=Alicyclobacillus macrosporangiidus TaxID=392015 RepID=UPI0026E95398|nr:dynamin family protein [Alicyclobacillus macrosporangiidus]MCL6598290.1 dynamin family protein [Alicyclobacillus macrosporangiidus]